MTKTNIKRIGPNILCKRSSNSLSSLSPPYIVFNKNNLISNLNKKIIYWFFYIDIQTSLKVLISRPKAVWSAIERPTIETIKIEKKLDKSHNIYLNKLNNKKKWSEKFLIIKIKINFKNKFEII